MNVMVINSGSSSVKYQLFDMRDRTVLASGLLERIGESDSRLKHQASTADGERQELEWTGPVSDHQAAMKRIGEAFGESDESAKMRDLYGFGHRVVHGGEMFKEPTLIDDAVIDAINTQSSLAPLHNPANVAGIEVARARFPQVPQVAVFDTAFHQSIPPHAYHYALPYELYVEHHVRRYGFHGTSHRYVATETARHLGRPIDELNLIVLHLGNGASVTAIEGGKSVDTSMGLTPLEGLVMGTRSGDIDPAIIFFLARATGRSNDEIENLLNKESGIKGFCGVSDMREVLELAESGDEQAQLAIDAYAYRIKKYIGAYFAVLGHVDAVVFTAGIGENAWPIREAAGAGLSNLGIDIDPALNRSVSREPRQIQTPESPVKVLVIPTDEELQIALETVEAIRRSQGA